MGLCGVRYLNTEKFRREKKIRREGREGREETSPLLLPHFFALVIIIIIIIITIVSLLTYSKQIAIYKLKVEKRTIKTYLQFISIKKVVIKSPNLISRLYWPVAGLRWFPLSCKFIMRWDVNLTVLKYANKISTGV